MSRMAAIRVYDYSVMNQNYGSAYEVNAVALHIPQWIKTWSVARTHSNVTTPALPNIPQWIQTNTMSEMPNGVCIGLFRNEFKLSLCQRCRMVLAWKHYSDRNSEWHLHCYYSVMNQNYNRRGIPQWIKTWISIRASASPNNWVWGMLLLRDLS